MLPVARSPITSQLSMSCTCSTGSTKILGSPVPWMMPSVWMCVPCLMPEAKLHEPAQPEAVLLRDGRAGTRSLARDHGQALAARTAPSRPTSPRYAAPVPIASAAAIKTQPADGSPYATFSITSSELTGIELGAAHGLRHPHAEQALAVQRLDDRLRELAVLVSVFGVLACERTDAFRSPG